MNQKKVKTPWLMGVVVGLTLGNGLSCCSESMVMHALHDFDALGVKSACLVKTITAPTTITTPGHYCLAGRIEVPGHSVGITILCDDVVLDLNGHTVDGMLTGSYGVVVSGGSERVKIGNGSIKNCLYAALLMANVSGGVVADLFIHGDTADCMTGIQVTGCKGITVERCDVDGFGGLCFNGIEDQPGQTPSSCSTIAHEHLGRPLGACFVIDSSKNCSFVRCTARNGTNHGFMAGIPDLVHPDSTFHVEYCNFIQCSAVDNKGAGFYLVDMKPVALRLSGTYNLFDACIAQGNCLQGFAVVSDFSTFRKCIANNNMVQGFSLYGCGMLMQACIANNNQAQGVFFGPELAPVSAATFAQAGFGLTAVFNFLMSVDLFIDNMMSNHNRDSGIEIKGGVIATEVDYVHGVVIRDSEATYNGNNGILFNISTRDNDAVGCYLLNNGGFGMYDATGLNNSVGNVLRNNGL